MAVRSRMPDGHAFVFYCNGLLINRGGLGSGPLRRRATLRASLLVNMLIHIVLLLVGTICGVLKAQVSEEEMQGMEALYIATQGYDWFYTGDGNRWNFDNDSDPCLDDWEGVTCANNTSIIAIDLTQHNLQGTLPNDISLISSLATLELNVNRIIRTLPCGLFFLPLATLQLSENRLSSTLPACIANATLLETLTLAHNRISGPLPSIVSCTSLRHLDLQNNTIYYEPLPHLSSDMQLQVINLNGNRFTGTIPTSWFNATSFTHISLANNSITSSLYGIDKWTQLQFLNLERNRIYGSLPSSLSTLTALSYVYLYNNHLNSTVPPSLLDIPSLALLDLRANRLSSSLPFPTAVQANMLALFLSGNQFMSSIPTQLGNYVHLRYLILSENELTGTLPVEFASLTDLLFLEINKNHLTGTIPNQYTALSALENVDFSSNHLSGQIPFLISSLPNLTSLVLGSNNFHGVVEFTSSADLTVLDISRNQFTDIIYYDAFQGIEQLRLGHNHFRGSIPSSVSDMSHLQVLAIENNYFSGNLPRELAHLQKLMVMQLQANVFKGQLQGVFNSTDVLPILEILDLSDNSFSGDIPDDIFNLHNIRSVSLTKNCFDGLPSMCSDTIEILALDGLSAGSRCKDQLWDPLKVYNTYFVVGSDRRIPDCVWNMSTLEVLHLSANGIIGNLENIVVSPNSTLSNISLAYNQMTGTIPKHVQDKVILLSEFDISYNKFAGRWVAIVDKTLNSFNTTALEDGTYTPSGKISMNVNRFSGGVPYAFTLFKRVNILGGNIFQCDDSKKDLPEQDPNYDTYICGSGALDSSLLTWGNSVLIISIVAVVTYVRRRMRQVFTLAREKHDRVSILEWLRHPSLAMLKVISKSRDVPLQSLLDFSCIQAVMNAHQLSHNETSVSRLKHVNLLFSSTYHFVRSVMLLTSFILVVFLPLYPILKMTYDGRPLVQDRQYSWFISGAYLSGTAAAVLLFLFWTLLIILCLILIYHRHAYVRRLYHSNTSTVRSRLQSLIKGSSQIACEYLAVILLNITVVFLVNGAYIYVQLDSSTPRLLKQASQPILAIFKLLWDTLVVASLLSRLSDDQKGSLDSRTWLYTLVVVFNNIVAPCLVTAVTDISCFRDVFVSETELEVKYTVPYCETLLFDSHMFRKYCVKTAQALFETRFIPPFNYNYQCSSAVLTNYIPVYLYTYAITVFVLPLLDIFQIKVKTSRLPIFAQKMIPGIMLPNRHRSITSPLFRVDRINATLMRHLSLLLTFGFASPPLAVAIAIAVAQYALKWKLLVVRYLAVLLAESYTDSTSEQQILNNSLLERLNEECKGSWRGAYVCLWAVLWPAALFTSCLFMDILGDDVGWPTCIWILCLTLCLPACLWLAMKYVANKNRYKAYFDEMSGAMRKTGSGRQSSDMGSERSLELRPSEGVRSPIFARDENIIT